MLQLAGRSADRFSIMRPAGLDLLESSPWKAAVVKLLILASELKRVVAFSLHLIGTIIYQRPLATVSDAEKVLVSVLFSLIRGCLELGLALLREGGTTIVYSSKSRQIGFLTADNVIMADRLVFVPGCFHHLVLRRQGQEKQKSNQWKLVETVAISTAITYGRSWSKGELTQLVKDKAVCGYIIE